MADQVAAQSAAKITAFARLLERFEEMRQSDGPCTAPRTFDGVSSIANVANPSVTYGATRQNPLNLRVAFAGPS